ncbi:MAG: hypothetical protein ACREQ5_03255 [Candidatus Dormibacteria bacterium]
MAVAIQVAGLCTVQVASSGSLSPLPSLVTLGYTMDGAEITFNGFFLDVPTDENGGDAGPPTDVQFMGMTANIRLQFTKYDETVMQFCRVRLVGQTVGIPGLPTASGGYAQGSVGQLLIGGDYTYRLLLNSPSNPYNFPTAFPRDPENLNRGTKFSTDVMEWYALRGGVGAALYNVSIT